MAIRTLEERLRDHAAQLIALRRAMVRLKRRGGAGGAGPRILSGRVTPAVINAGATGFVDVTFPPGAFTAPPDVTVTPETTAPSNPPCSVASVTATSMRLYQGNTGMIIGAAPMHWIAVQTD